MLKNLLFNPVTTIFFLVMLLMLSALRGLSLIYYIVVILCFLILFIRAFSSNPFPSGFIASVFYIFFVYTIWLVGWSAIYMQSFGFLPGVPRIFLVLTFTLILFLYVRTEKHFKAVLLIIFFCYVLAAMSVIYQIIFGEISWFTDQVSRAKLNRYSSILGSLTIFGSVVGYGLIMVYSSLLGENKILLKVFLFFILISGAFYCLSKAAVTMVALSVPVYLLFDFRSIIQRSNLKTIIILTSILAIVFILLMQIESYTQYYNAIVTQTIGDKSIFSSGVGVQIDSPSVSTEIILKRLFYWTSSMLTEYGNIVYFSGVGLQGGAGTLGVLKPDGSHFISSHNGLGDLFFIGGLPYIFLFLLLYFYTQLILYRNRSNGFCRLFFMLNILFFANLLVVSGSSFHPAISMIFWTSVVYANIKNNFSNAKYYHNNFPSLK